MNEDLIDFHDESATSVVRPFFPKMIAISLAVHLVFAIIITGGGSGRPGDPTINYLDLTMSEPAAAITPPPAPPVLMTEPVEEAVVPPVEQAPPVPTEADKMKQEAQEAVRTANEQPEAMQKVSFGLGLLNGHFGTIADGKTLRGDMREYHLSLLKAINENWWRNGIKYEGIKSAMVTIVVSRNGEIINAQIMQSSGNPSYDRIMLKSLIGVNPLPPLPAHFDQQVYTAPVKFNPPLSLFGS